MKNHFCKLIQFSYSTIKISIDKNNFMISIQEDQFLQQEIHRKFPGIRSLIQAYFVPCLCYGMSKAGI